MIPLSDKPNVESPSAEYPFGNIKDNTGTNNGTPVNKLVYADFHQFFEKMMAVAGITANGLPDSETNGFQLFEALLGAMKTQNEWITIEESSFPSGWFVLSGDQAAYRINRIGEVEMKGTVVNGSAGPVAFTITLPTGFRPPNPIKFNVFTTSGEGVGVNTSGVVTATGNDSTGNLVYLYGVRFYPAA